MDPARPWRIAIPLSAAAVYLPQLVPLATTDLLSHPNGCLAQYERLFPVLVGLAPGISVRIASNVGEPGEEVVLWIVMILVTAALLLGTAVALHRWRRAGPLVAVGVALLATNLSLAAVGILRM